MLSVIARLVADTVLVGALLFGAAGTLAWGRAWVLLGALLLLRTAGASAVYRVNPALVRDRVRLPIDGEQPWADRLLVASVLASGFLGVPIVAALDRFHWHALVRPAPWVAAVGLVLFTLGWGLKSLALRANAFATAAVRLQRGHIVIDSGVYGVIRHPFYAADPLILVGLGLWLQSYLAVLFAALPVTLMILRLLWEERFLQRALPGYEEYTSRVRHRLVPGLW